MSLLGQSLLSVETLTESSVGEIFDRAHSFKKEFQRLRRFDHLVSKGLGRPIVLAMVFLEPSTRTRISFQSAAYRLGFRTVIFDSPFSSSMKKGETPEDTFKNVAAMLPDLMVVRYNDSVEVEDCLNNLGCPVVNGGSGTGEHPTQALLDVFTISDNFNGQLEQAKVLMVGDVLHSRVASSNIKLLTKLGVNVKVCGPPELLPKKNGIWKNIEYFHDLNEGLNWANVLMGLRVQEERHESIDSKNSLKTYRENYQIGPKALKNLSTNSIILHPGPIIKGLEFTEDVLNDQRCRVFQQVTNGLFIRAAIYSLILGLEV